ncbi:hypothetical protein QDR37_04495 [Amnibacterium sp. CER49]|uniref:hypothetical protein n=1 Tax=Amnibacterium sp. CER49 TaxID=3039161 RepID=UPI0024484DC7|nr:hypothetical protein [Amnibacterium sp. CER49]MDH2443202.1 hypothetical protein [Amnibacterium sp. CER49]
MAVPAVLLVLAACLGGLTAGAEQLRLQGAAALAARSVARGDGEARAGVMATEAGAGAVRFGRTADGVVCATASAEVVVTLAARACALGAAG